MAQNVIMRVVYNRPEMLQISIEHEIQARKYYMLSGEFITLFIVEYGASPETLKLIEQYPFRNHCIFRPQKFGLTMNILEGMKEAFSLAEDYVIYIEDDILLHKTYFEYIDVILNMENLGKFSVVSPWSPDDGGSVNEVRKIQHYAALAPLINKDFYIRYIYQCSNETYYRNPAQFVIALNEKYREYWGKGYKYRDATHWEQAGCINRLIDAAMIDDGMCVIIAGVNRQRHIGYFGKNHPGGIIPGNSFEERLVNLREIIKDADKMYEMSATKQYRDCWLFSPKLNEWDGTLRLV